ncbi:MAG TPA: ribosome biogenesis GTPase Der [Acidiferrobacteraceae bacterium]|nr:ribosome biogenesis GTPase Der [Acidiferrobacteraceae bacterium]
MTSVVVLVGRPNVGKSTLFNRLTRSRDALVADTPGLTRDRLYGIGRIGDRPYLVVDTGGLEGEQNGLTGLVTSQTTQAIDEADVVLFLTDNKEGLTGLDRDIADKLRRAKKPVLVAVNKSEGIEKELAVADFFALGLGDPVSISAAHGQGVAALMERALSHLPAVEAGPLDSDVPHVAVAGRPNAGKSTLVNALFGEQRVVVFDEPGTTRDSIHIPLERRGKPYVLIDTAGVRRRSRIDDTLEKFSVIKTLQAIEVSNVVVFLLDAQREVSAQDASLAGFVLDAGKSMVLAVNKWDKLETGQRDWIRREVHRKLPFLRFLEPHFISALHGTGVGDLFPAIDRAYRSAMVECATSKLNRILEQAIRSTAPPMGRGRPIKLKFAHQAGRNPPLIRIHGNQVDQIPKAYRRYLANQFRKALRLEGTPVRIDFQAGENPYKGRKSASKRGERGARVGHRQ